MNIAVIVSKWHLSNLEAYLLRSGKQLDLLIISPQSNIMDETRFRITVEDIKKSAYLSNVKLKFEKIGFNFFVFFCNLLRSVFSKEKTNIISPGTINTSLIGWERLKGKPEFTIIDEGTASYVHPKDHLRISRKTGKSLRSINFWVLKLKLLLIKLISKIFKINNELLFENKESTFNVNTHIAKSINSVYIERNSKEDLYNSNQNQRTILLIIDLYDPFGDENYFYSLYKEIISSFQSEGKVYIKPHPNDLNRYRFSPDVGIIDSKKEIESIVPLLQPDIVIGGISTSTFTIPVVFGIKTISLLKIYLKCKNLDKDYRKRFLTFSQLSSEIVFLPSSVEEIKHEL
ncbi:MAG: hypothetical protein GWP32_04900 [Bacteroidetes bacterium]|nr:hypothetical protein [Bacteroidota bacterium]